MLVHKTIFSHCHRVLLYTAIFQLFIQNPSTQKQFLRTNLKHNYKIIFKTQLQNNI